VPGEEARQRAGADRDPAFLKSLTQLAQEDLRAGLVGLPDEVGMSLDVAGALVAAQRLGRDVAHAPLLLRPTAGAGPAHAEALGGLPAGRPGRNRGRHALAQIDGQGCRHGLLLAPSTPSRPAQLPIGRTPL
jgi:hypothetical protein